MSHINHKVLEKTENGSFEYDIILRKNTWAFAE